MEYISSVPIKYINPNATIGFEDNQLVASVSQASYQWINCSDNTPIEGATGQYFDFIPGGFYSVAVEIEGCKDTSSCIDTQITANIDYETFAPIQIYPNPTNATFSVTGIPDNANISLINASGEIVFRENDYRYNSTEMDLSNFKDGIYLLQIMVDQKIWTYKIVKQ